MFMWCVFVHVCGVFGVFDVLCVVHALVCVVCMVCGLCGLCSMCGMWCVVFMGCVVYVMCVVCCVYMVHAMCDLCCLHGACVLDVCELCVVGKRDMWCLWYVYAACVCVTCGVYVLCCSW